MGCASSKQIRDDEADVFKPAPVGFLLFDVNTIEEPWKTHPHQSLPKIPPPSVTAVNPLPTPILHTINKLESPTDVPLSWSEVSQALELDFNSKKTPPVVSPPAKSTPQRDRLSFHTLEELAANLTCKTTEETTTVEMKKPSLTRTKTDVQPLPPVVNTETQKGVAKSLKDNPFIVRDRVEREKGGAKDAYDRMMNYNRNPLADYPEKCPPGGENSLVVYTTSLRGVRKTYGDCARVLSILENHSVVLDERDVSLHGEFLSELRMLIGEEERAVTVPRMFLKGRDLGSVEAVVELNESGRLGRMLGYAGVGRKVGWQSCNGCGGARFVPCLVCHGSCKVMGDENGDKVRCKSCNENGLVRCRGCH